MRASPPTAQISTASKLTAVILTRDEEQHLHRAIASIQGIASRILVVDSGSTDRTCEIARACGADVKFHPWVNYATQFNWALEQLGEDTDWVLRLDADEIVSEDLAKSISDALKAAPERLEGFYVDRRMTFMRRPIRHGGIFPIKVLRVFKRGHGRCEERWMDEHVKVAGETATLSGELLDDNCNSLTWWIGKHNSYASREAIDLLNLQYRFMPLDTVASLSDKSQAGLKRWLKEHVYSRLPLGGRAFIYFCYRYVFRLGFLDGREGTAFHFLQGFWYRYLVDAKLIEVQRSMVTHGSDVTEAIRIVLGVDVQKAQPSRNESKK